MTTAPQHPPSGSAPNGKRSRRAPREPRVGDVIGQYMLVDELAAGGMGRVFRAVDREGNAYALKTILKNEGIYRKRFEREVQVGMVLDHPHLVKLVDCDMNTPWPYLVQELLMGVNLRDLYKARRRLPERAVMVIVLQISRALNAAVRYGIIHRDIKPDNIFMTTAGACKLLDMGLVKVGGMVRVTDAQDLVGTLQFMAPEQLRDASTVDHHADVYSLGATAFLLLTGRLPRRGNNVREVTQAMLSTPIVSPRRVYPKVSTEADAIIARMTMVDPLQRYESPAQLVAEVERYCRGIRLDPETLPSSFLLHELIPESMESDSSDEPLTSSSSADYVPSPNPFADSSSRRIGSSSSSEWVSAGYITAQSTGRIHEVRGDISDVHQLPLTPEPVHEPLPIDAETVRRTRIDRGERTPPHAIPLTDYPASTLPPPPPPPRQRSSSNPRLGQEGVGSDSGILRESSSSQDPVPVPHDAAHPGTHRIRFPADEDADDDTTSRELRRGKL